MYCDFLFIILDLFIYLILVDVPNNCVASDGIFDSSILDGTRGRVV